MNCALKKHFTEKIQYKKLAVVFIVFFILWFFNLCTPLIFDDYIYSYIFTGSSMGYPMPNESIRINGLHDILISQWNHYFLWGGRTVAHILVQFFLWKGKAIFNFVNAACFVLVFFESCWIINKGKINFDFNIKDFLWFFGLFWVFSLFLNSCYTWLTLSCNYLWTLMILLLYLLLFVRFYFTLEQKKTNQENNCLKRMMMFIFGIIAGWTNENTVIFVIFVLGYWIFLTVKNRFSEESILMICGLSGLIIGYCFLIFAPGNYVRYTRLLQDGIIIPGMPLLKNNFVFFVKIFISRFVLFWLAFRSLFFLTLKTKLDQESEKMLSVSKVFLFLSLASLAVMIFSPEFRFRSSFQSLIFLLISLGLVKKVQIYHPLKHFTNYYKLNPVIKFLVISYVSFTLLSSLYVYDLQRRQTQTLLTQIYEERMNPTGTVLVVRERPALVDERPAFAIFITGGHVPYPMSLTDNENYWINKDVALYYNIRGIRSGK